MLKLNMNPKQYKIFVSFAIKTCDSMSLVFLKNNKNKTEYIFQEEYFLILESVLKKKSDIIHPDTGSYFADADILYLKTDSTAVTLLMKASNIFDWNGITLPEELCFYRNGKVWCTCICHERLLLIHNETNIDIEFLKKNKIKFICE